MTSSSSSTDTTCTAGANARDVLHRLDDLYGDGYANTAHANIVSEEPNVRQMAAKAALREADAAIVYATDAASLDPDAVITLPIHDAYGVTATYPIAELTSSRQPELARAFHAFVLSPEGRVLLTARGFGAP
jgi:ABC-type molybdate transport system, periplasmic component